MMENPFALIRRNYPFAHASDLKHAARQSLERGHFHIVLDDAALWEEEWKLGRLAEDNDGEVLRAMRGRMYRSVSRNGYEAPAHRSGRPVSGDGRTVCYVRVESRRKGVRSDRGLMMETAKGRLPAGRTYVYPPHGRRGEALSSGAVWDRRVGAFHMEASRIPPDWNQEAEERRWRSREARIRSRSGNGLAAAHLEYIERRGNDEGGEIASDEHGAIVVSNVGQDIQARRGFWEWYEETQVKAGGISHLRMICELPHCLPESGLRRVVLRMSEELNRRGFPHTAVVHCADAHGDPRNVHVHWLLTDRPGAAKDGVWQFDGVKDRSMRGPPFIAWLRELHVDSCNGELAGHSALESPSPQLDERGRGGRTAGTAAGIADIGRSVPANPANAPIPEDGWKRWYAGRYEDLGISRRSQTHLGPLNAALERAGIPTWQGVRNGVLQNSYDGIERLASEQWSLALHRAATESRMRIASLSLGLMRDTGGRESGPSRGVGARDARAAMYPLNRIWADLPTEDERRIAMSSGTSVRVAHEKLSAAIERHRSVRQKLWQAVDLWERTARARRRLRWAADGLSRGPMESLSPVGRANGGRGAAPPPPSSDRRSRLLARVAEEAHSVIDDLLKGGAVSMVIAGKTADRGIGFPPTETSGENGDGKDLQSTLSRLRTDIVLLDGEPDTLRALRRHETRLGRLVDARSARFDSVLSEHEAGLSAAALGRLKRIVGELDSLPQLRDAFDRRSAAAVARGFNPEGLSALTAGEVAEAVAVLPGRRRHREDPEAFDRTVEMLGRCGALPRDFVREWQQGAADRAAASSNPFVLRPRTQQAHRMAEDAVLLVEIARLQQRIARAEMLSQLERRRRFRDDLVRIGGAMVGHGTGIPTGDQAAETGPMTGSVTDVGAAGRGDAVPGRRSGSGNHETDTVSRPRPDGMER